MTTITRFTKEKLIAAACSRIDFARQMLLENPLPLAKRKWEIELSLSEIALASLEAEKCAEPVAFINGAWTLVYYRPPKELGLKVGDKLYTAPRAPVAVPDFGALTKCIIQRLVDYGAADDDAVASAEEFVYNACRAALLQGAEPVSNRDELQVGWIPVSERMPEKGQRVIAFVEFDSSVVTPLIKDAEYTGSTFRIGPNTVNIAGEPRVTHWMTLPAAPQQEVKSE